MGKKVVRLLVTGGTIDEDSPDPRTGKSLFTVTHVPQMLAEVGVADDIIVEELMMKDSSDITENDREKILKSCQSCAEEIVVVTHGTNTMVETANFLGKKLSEKVVVLVGAFIPYLKEDSDAVVNLEYAYSQAVRLPPGVYVAMNQEVFNWDNVRKNKEKQVFENLRKTVE